MKNRWRNRTTHARRNLQTKLMIILVLVAMLVAGLYAGGQYLENRGKTPAFGDLQGRFEAERVVSYQGKDYIKNSGLSSYLFMGIDQPENQPIGTSEFRSGGQCDFLMLLIIDAERQMIRRIQIDRDAMAEITVLGVLGNDLGTNTHQICLAHGFGDGRERSCQFTVEAVQRLLCGIEIDGYFSLNLDGIETLNDLLGGVTVKIQDDFSALDPAMVPGATITLQGRQTEIFVRERMSVGDGTNAARMIRQQTFLGEAADMIGQRVREDANFIGKLFDGLKGYTITDISRGKMINEANRAAHYITEGVQILPGEHKIGSDGFVEFHTEGEALMELVLDVFYTPAQ